MTKEICQVCGRAFEWDEATGLGGIHTLVEDQETGEMEMITECWRCIQGDTRSFPPTGWMHRALMPKMLYASVVILLFAIFIGG